jgi:hypothetical protein
MRLQAVESFGILYRASKFGGVGSSHHPGRQLLPGGILIAVLCARGSSTLVANARDVSKGKLMVP